jgi:hypothetical protein
MLNPYTYVTADPTNHTDPTGMAPQWARWLLTGIDAADTTLGVAALLATPTPLSNLIVVGVIAAAAASAINVISVLDEKFDFLPEEVKPWIDGVNFAFTAISLPAGVLGGTALAGKVAGKYKFPKLFEMSELGAIGRTNDQVRKRVDELEGVAPMLRSTFKDPNTCYACCAAVAGHLNGADAVTPLPRLGDFAGKWITSSAFQESMGGGWSRFLTREQVLSHVATQPDAHYAVIADSFFPSPIGQLVDLSELGHYFNIYKSEGRIKVVDGYWGKIADPYTWMSRPQYHDRFRIMFMGWLTSS